MVGREGPAKQKCTSHPPDYPGLLWITFSRSSLLSHAHDMLSHISAYPHHLFICSCSCSLRIPTMPHGWNGSSDYIITCTVHTPTGQECVHPCGFSLPPYGHRSAREDFEITDHLQYNREHACAFAAWLLPSCRQRQGFAEPSAIRRSRWVGMGISYFPESQIIHFYFRKVVPS